MVVPPLRLRFSVIELPAPADPDESPSATDWAEQSELADRAIKSAAPAWRWALYKTEFIKVPVRNIDWLHVQSTDTFVIIKSGPPLSCAT
jgi:hypothetical protein